MPLIFDTCTRTDLDPAKYSDSKFGYLNRSARPEAERVRDLIEVWAANYPKEHLKELRTRLRGAGHISAFFELALHEMLRRFQYSLEIHPEVPSRKTTRPDFLVKASATEEFYVEGVLTSDPFEPDAASQARLNQVYDVLNRMDSPNFFLDVSISGSPTKSPPVKKIREFLKRELAQLDPEDVAQTVEKNGLEASPKWQFGDNDWNIEIRPIPKSLKARGKPGVRPIGIISPEAKWIDGCNNIRDAVKDKGGKYGDLQLPYIVAVNALGGFVRDIDVIEALFGKESFVFDRDDLNKPPVMKRRLNGAWTSPARAVYTRVSGVLIANNLTPWNVARSFVRLYHNPWAKRPISQQLFPIPQAVPDDNTMRQVDGLAIRDVFELPERWPED